MALAEAEGAGDSGRLVINGTKGRYRELIVITYLMERGWNVYQAVDPCSPCDLIAERNGSLIRVEVTSGRYRKSGGVSHSHIGREHLYDVLAWFDGKRGPFFHPGL